MSVLTVSASPTPLTITVGTTWDPTHHHQKSQKSRLLHRHSLSLDLQFETDRSERPFSWLLSGLENTTTTTHTANTANTAPDIDDRDQFGLWIGGRGGGCDELTSGRGRKGRPVSMMPLSVPTQQRQDRQDRSLDVRERCPPVPDSVSSISVPSRPPPPSPSPSPSPPPSPPPLSSSSTLAGPAALKKNKRRSFSLLIKMKSFDNFGVADKGKEKRRWFMLGAPSPPSARGSRTPTPVATGVDEEIEK
ncbi:hypothetical protein HK102_011303, partial [Quaeritorhiza haematococci]